MTRKILLRIIHTPTKPTQNSPEEQASGELGSKHSRRQAGENVRSDWNYLNVEVFGRDRERLTHFGE